MVKFRITALTNVLLCFIAISLRQFQSIQCRALDNQEELLFDTTEEREALHKLLRVFGMNHPGRPPPNHAPPEYMLDLYNTLADSSEVSSTVHPYHANIVRSFPDKDHQNPQKFYFNVTASIPPKERILEAEFHLYKTKAKEIILDQESDVLSHLLEIRVYEVKSTNTTSTEEGNRLLDVRRVSTHSSGWEVFYVKPAVIDWLQNSETNHGLLVTVRTMLGAVTDNTITKFAKRHHHHNNKQPFLVIFTDDGRPKKLEHQNKSFRSYGYRELLPDSSFFTSSANERQQDDYSENNVTDTETPISDATNASRSRSQRAAGTNDHMQTPSGCTRHELRVDFEKIGWSSWIISPKWYNAYFCKGKCNFPLGQNQWPTNHATVQSIVHELELVQGVGAPCCVPNKLHSINLLYFDEHENVILKNYDDMVAVSCGCH